MVTRFLGLGTLFPRQKKVACAVLNFAEKPIPYVATKNPAHEPVAGRVQKTSGEHPIISTTVCHGDQGYGHFIEDG